jgi:uncharacterized protein with HEPN domain
MPSKNAAQRLRDILENLDLIGEFTRGLAYGGFAADAKTVYAVVPALEIVSDATRKLPPEMKLRRPHIDWAAIAASGNIYRHEHEAVDESLVWYTAQNGTGALRQMATCELELLVSGKLG